MAERQPLTAEVKMGMVDGTLQEWMQVGPFRIDYDMTDPHDAERAEVLRDWLINQWQHCDAIIAENDRLAVDLRWFLEICDTNTMRDCVKEGRLAIEAREKRLKERRAG